jgi:threonine dehydrogenase-like Zn-dependent dehydrogenase
MRAIVWHGPGRMAVEERPEPGAPGADELIVAPEAVGICGSEVEGYLGHMANRTPPLVMGHEFAGVVVAAGAGAEAWEGARVAVNPLAGCGTCALCVAGTRTSVRGARSSASTTTAPSPTSSRRRPPTCGRSPTA